MMFDCGLQNIFRLKSGQSRSINWENRNGEKGKGGMASSDLGPSRKGSPCIPKIEAGETVTLGEIQGEGMIQHIWITVTDRTSERNRYVLRDLVLRMYWDDEEFPSVECPLGDFFCCGFGVSYQVNSVPIAVNPTRGFNSYFPMPFRKNARITIENQCDEPIPAFFYQIRLLPDNGSGGCCLFPCPVASSAHNGKGKRLRCPRQHQREGPVRWNLSCAYQPRTLLVRRR